MAASGALDGSWGFECVDPSIQPWPPVPTRRLPLASSLPLPSFGPLPARSLIASSTAAAMWDILKTTFAKDRQHSKKATEKRVESPMKVKGAHVNFKVGEISTSRDALHAKWVGMELREGCFVQSCTTEAGRASRGWR